MDQHSREFLTKYFVYIIENQLKIGYTKTLKTYLILSIINTLINFYLLKVEKKQ